MLTFVYELRTIRPMILSFAIFFSAEIGQASGATIVSSDGHEYDITCNLLGYRLISKYPIVRPVGVGAATQYFKENEILFLGKSCDALSETWRTGKWCWQNGGVLVDFAKIKIGFPRGEISCEINQSNEGLPCSCN